MNNYTGHDYFKAAERLSRERLLNQYRAALFAREYRRYILAGTKNPPWRAVQEQIANIEKSDPIGFLDDFKRWADIQGWLPCAGSIMESGAGTQAADGVNS